MGHYQNIDPDRSKTKLHIIEERGTFYLQTPDPDEKPFKIIPISKHLGVLQRKGASPWITLDFKEEKDGYIMLPLGRWSYKKLIISDQL